MSESNELIVPGQKESPVKYSDELKRVVQEQLPELKRRAQMMPAGFQYEVVVHPTSNSSSVANQSLEKDSVAVMAFNPNLDTGVRQKLGILNVMGALQGDEIEFDYHSITGGKDFRVKIGEEVEFEGMPAEVAANALSTVLKTIPSEGRNQEGFYLGSVANREFVDREGKPIEQAKQISTVPQKGLPSAK